MEFWVLCALASAFFGGVYNFLMKIISRRGYDTALMLCYSFGLTALFFLIYALSSQNDIRDIKVIITLALFNGIFFFVAVLTRIESLRNIDSVLFFPIYKTIGPILVTGISIFFFGEMLSGKEVLGVILGICVPLLLITTNEDKIQRNLKKGVLFLLIAAIFGAITTIPMKELMVRGLNQELFIFFAASFSMVSSYISFLFFQPKNSDVKYFAVHEYLKFGLLVAIFNIGGAITFLRAMEGNLAIVYTVNSFSILIPIILSIWFYKEHFSFKKGFVILLSIVSIILFI